MKSPMAFPAAPPAPESPLRRFARDYCESPAAVAALLGLVAIVGMAIFAGWLSPQNPYDLAQLDALEGQLKPGSRAAAGFTYWLGTDTQGRDVLSAIMYGLRMSLLVGAISTVIAVAIGVALGLVSAYVGGRLDALLMRLADIQFSFPTILIALILLAVLGRGVDKVIIALVAVQWAVYARTARGSALVEHRKEYVDAARCLALPGRRILFRHIMPNCLPPVIVVATMQVAHAISLEATLSFLGVGVPITEPSLGLLIANGYSFMFSGEYWISFYPGLALLLAVVCINLVGDQLRDVLNPRRRR